MEAHLLVTLILGIQLSSFAQDMSDCDVGVIVRSVSEAIDTGMELDTIVKYGTDSRYYVMIRGWLVQELVGVESQFESANSPAQQNFKNRIAFLKKAIRRIDLE